MTPAHLGNYIEGEAVKKAMQTLTKFEQCEYIVKTNEFNGVRDHIIMMITIHNGCRAGAMIGLRHKHLEDATVASNGITVISVWIMINL